MVTEDMPGDWFLDSLICTGVRPDKTSRWTRPRRGHLKPGDNVTCTYANKPKGELIVKKETVPNGSDEKLHVHPDRLERWHYLPVAGWRQRAAGAPGRRLVARTEKSTGRDLSKHRL